MEFNLQTQRSGFSRLFSGAFRVGNETPQPSNQFLIPPQVDEDDAVRVLIGSRGVFKVDGKGEVPPIEKAGKERDTKRPSLLQKSLTKLSSIAKDIKAIKEDIADGKFSSPAQIEAAQSEIAALGEEYKKITESNYFKKALATATGLRRDLTALDDEALYGSGNSPIVSQVVNDLASQQNATKLNGLLSKLEKVADASPGSLSINGLEELIDTIDEARAIESGGTVEEVRKGALELLLTDLRDITRELRYVELAKEEENLDPERREQLSEQEKQLKDQFKEIITSQRFKEVLGALENVASLRKSSGTDVAAQFAAENADLLGSSLGALLSGYHFGELEELNNVLGDLGKAGENLDDLSATSLGSLSSKLSRAVDIVSGDTLNDGEESKFLKRTLDLNETEYEKADRAYKTELFDEIEDFFRVAEEDAKGAYLLSMARVPKGQKLSIFA